jgi:holo-[acyl-carrier protein] synthase
MIVGIGIDVVDIARVERMLESLGERALRRLFAPGEADYIRGKKSRAQHAAVRLAAKEAAFKALSGTPRARLIGWREVEVANGWDGSPSLLFHGVARERLEELGVSQAHLSLTHSAASAVAVVVLESATTPGLANSDKS